MGPGIARAVEGDAATKDSMDRVMDRMSSSSEEVRNAAIAEYEQYLLTKKAAIESE